MAIDVMGLLFSPESATKIKGGELDIPFDAAEVVEHHFRNLVTDEPREDGTLVSDHVLSQPDELVIEGVVSDFPLAGNLGTAIAGAVATRVVGGVAGVVAGGLVRAATGGAIGSLADLTGVQRPRQTAYDLLKRAVKEHLLLNVVTSLGTFANMVAESLDVTQSWTTANALRFRLALRTLVTATTSESPLDLVDALPGTADLAAATSERGFRPAVAS